MTADTIGNRMEGRMELYLGSTADFHPGSHSALAAGLRHEFDVKMVSAVAHCHCHDPLAFDPITYFYYTRVNRFPEDAKFIYSAYYAVANEVPWLVDMDDICLPLYHDNHLYPNVAQLFRGSSMQLADVLLSRIGAYATTHCRGILFWSRDSLERAKRVITALGLMGSTEASAFFAKATVAYPSIPVRTFDDSVSRPGRPTITFIAKDYHDKGGHIALSLYAALLDKHVDARLVYIGPIPPAEKFAHRSTLDRIVYSDVVSRTTALRLLATSDILVSPTQFESFGFVLLEAMASGCIPIAYGGGPCAVIDEIIDDGVTGYVVARRSEPGHAEEEAARFLEKVLILFDTPALLQNMRQAARFELTSGRFSFDSKIALIRRLLLGTPQPSLLDTPRYHSRPFIACDPKGLEDQIEQYRQAHNVSRRLVV